MKRLICINFQYQFIGYLDSNLQLLLFWFYLILKWYAQNNVRFYYLFFRDFFCYHFFLLFWRGFKMSKPSTEIVFLCVPGFRRQHEWIQPSFVVKVASLEIYFRIKTEFSGISLFIHPSHIHQLHSLLKTTSWEMISYIADTFYC